MEINYFRYECRYCSKTGTADWIKNHRCSGLKMKENKMKKIILNGSTDEIHIKDVDMNKPIFVKKEGKFIGMVVKEPIGPLCGIYTGGSHWCQVLMTPYDLIQHYSRSGYTFHLED